jgi:hypothetical protein
MNPTTTVRSEDRRDTTWCLEGVAEGRPARTAGTTSERRGERKRHATVVSGSKGRRHYMCQPQPRDPLDLGPTNGSKQVKRGRSRPIRQGPMGRRVSVW